MTHWIIEMLVYEVRTRHVVSAQLTCCHRIAHPEIKGVWMVRGAVHMGSDDTFEFKERVIDIDEFAERTKRMHCYSLSVHPFLSRSRP